MLIEHLMKALIMTIFYALQAAWMLLAEVSQFTVSMDSKFLFDNWQKYSGNIAMDTGSPLVPILITIGNAAKKLSRIAIEDIRGIYIIRL